MSVLAVENLLAGYGKTRILNGVSLSVEPHEIVTILGANGSGKSTLLKAIAGVVDIMGGRVTFGGDRIDGMSSYRIAETGISFVPQTNNAFPSLTVEENLQLAAGGRKAESWKVAYEIFPQLTDYRDRRAGLLSGGGRQMLGISMGIVAEPRLLMLDEPTAALSPKMAHTILDTVISEIRPRGIPVLMVEQRVTEALAIADRAYVMAQGRVVREGSADSFSQEALAEMFLSG